MSKLTRNFQKDGVRYIYCALCDYHYIAGTFREHSLGGLHQERIANRIAMRKWYRVNGYPKAVR